MPSVDWNWKWGGEALRKCLIRPKHLLRVFFMQISVAVKKILYAADAKESALDEAQEYLNQTLNGGEDEPEPEA